MNFILKHKIKIAILVAVVISGGILMGVRSNDQELAQDKDREIPVVETVRAFRGSSTSPNAINASGEVVAQMNASISSQTSGVIERVPVDIGDRVNRGSIIAEFENASERASVRQAKAGLQNARARLNELIAGARPSELENSRLSVKQAETNLEEAETLLLNTDLQAYLVESNVALGEGASLNQPDISGNYRSQERGEYRLSLYRSSTPSGFSFRYSGLENGVGVVSTEAPQPLGTRGLFIEFPDNFAGTRNVKWVVPVPNTRSMQFIQAENNLERARQGLGQAENNFTITREGTRVEQIEAQRAQVESARANVDSARAQLSKTIVSAPFSGTVLSVSVESGEYRNVGQTIAKLVNESRLEIRTFVSEGNARNITVGDSVLINNEYTGRVIAKAPAIDSETGNIEIRVNALGDASENLVSGSFVNLVFSAEGGEEAAGAVLPLSAVGTDASGSYILVVNDSGVLEEVRMETGAITGDRVAINGELPESPIVADVAGLSAGDRVRISENNNGQ